MTAPITARLAALLAAPILVGGLALATPAQADTLTMDFDHSFGATPSDGVAPWLRAVFQDLGTGTVRLTLSAIGLSNDAGGGGQQAEYADEWWFNLNPNYSADNLVADHVSGQQVTSIDRPSGGVSKLKADGDGIFSFRLNFAHGSLALNQTSVYDLTVTGYTGLNVADFNYYSIPSGGAGPFLAAAHIQSTGAGNLGSDFVAPTSSQIPEPASLALLAASLLGLGLARRRA